jgi:DNA-binding Lrp family transcriptional regulator
MQFPLVISKEVRDDTASEEILHSPVIDDRSRLRLMQEMEKLGINTSSLESLTISQLSDLLCGMHQMANGKSSPKAEPDEKHRSFLSQTDKKMLNALLHSNGDISSLSLSRQLKIPLTTVQRRRKRLEQVIDSSYSLKIEEFGLRMITFFVTVEGKSAIEVGKEALSIQRVISVERMIGGNIDVEIKAIVATNKDIAQLSEQLKTIPGVKELSWNERVSIIGKNSGVYISIIESL